MRLRCNASVLELHFSGIDDRPADQGTLCLDQRVHDHSTKEVGGWNRIVVDIFKLGRGTCLNSHTQNHEAGLTDRVDESPLLDIGL